MALTSEEPITEAEQNLKAAEDRASKKPLFKFILTGGPCGGKTTAIARLTSFLRERGFEVIACAEVYTIFASNGMSFDFYTTDGMDVVIQNSVLDVQLSLEDSLERVLKASAIESGLVCDQILPSFLVIPTNNSSIGADFFLPFRNFRRGVNRQCCYAIEVLWMAKLISLNKSGKKS
jgi:hypothetical protein